MCGGGILRLCQLEYAFLVAVVFCGPQLRHACGVEHQNVLEIKKMFCGLKAKKPQRNELGKGLTREMNAPVDKE